MDKKLIAAGLAFAAVAAFAYVGVPKLSLASSQGNVLTGDTSGKEYSFFTSSGWTYYSDYHESLNLYGDKVYVENLEKSTGTEDDIARVHIGSKSKVVDLDETYTADGVSVTVDSTKNQYIGYGGFSNTYSYYNALGWNAEVKIPREDISVDIHSFSLQKTGPGKRKVSFNASLTNNWHRIAVDKVTVQAFGKTHDLPVGPYLDTGTKEYRLTGSFSEYDISQYKVNKTVNKSIRIRIEDPRIPATEKSIDGADPLANPDFQLPDLKTEEAWFTADIRYCGEKAEYVDGECQIDEDLHLRGDTCFLPQNYTIVTETFSPGTYTRSDISPDASYFCSRHPAIVTNDGVQTDRTTSPYRKLVDDKAFSVPKGQTYTLFWVVDANEVDVTRVCEEGTLNKTTGDCVVRPSVVHKCDSGVWSPEQGSCVVSPDTKTVCDQGRYNKELGVCVFTPEVKKQCPIGTELGQDGMCYAQADVKRVCPDGVNGTIQGGHCTVDAVTVVRDSPLASFRVFLYDLEDWITSHLPFL